MRRQPEFLEAAAPGRVQKPDPARLPLCLTAGDVSADSVLALDSDRRALARRVSAVAERISLPLAEYRGVAIRIVPGLTEDEDRVAVVLSHADAALEVPLYEAEDDQNVIAEWRLWASTLGLPLLMEGLDGHAVAAENRLGEVEVDRPRPRRRHAHLSGRRPRFLTRRRTGKLPLVPFVHLGEREITAAD